MSGRYRGQRFLRAWCAGLFAAFLAGCQNVPADQVLDAGKGAAAKAEEVIGSGPVPVTMLLPRSGAGAAIAVDFRNGAAMALADLGGEKVTLTIYDTQGSRQKVGALALKAAESGAAAIVGPTADELVGGVTEIPAEKRPPIITLATNAAALAPGVFAFVSDEVDSALVGVRAASPGRKLIVLVPEDASKGVEERLRRGSAEAGADLLAFLRYGRSEPEFRALLLKNLKPVSQAGAVLILGSDSRPAILARLVRAALENESAAIIGTSAWQHEAYADPAVAGALIGLVDQGSLEIISGRYQERFGRPLSVEAAFAYDAVGILCGLVRARGAEALTIKTLRSPVGFRGATGIFRFTADGHVQRRFALYRIDKGKLTQARSMPEGF